jgi:plastocyanin
MMRTLTVLSVVAALGLFAGCGDDDDAGATPAAAPPAQTTAPDADSTATAPSESSESGGAEAAAGQVAVSMKDIEFVPDQVTVKVGQEIVWTNDEAIVHNVVAQEGADFESETMQEGDTFTYTPTEPGTIEYVCTFHPGQDGTITVED